MSSPVGAWCLFVIWHLLSRVDFFFSLVVSFVQSFTQLQDSGCKIGRIFLGGVWVGLFIPQRLFVGGTDQPEPVGLEWVGLIGSRS